MSDCLSILDLLVPGEPAEHSVEALEHLLEEALERGNAEHVEIVGSRILARHPGHGAAVRALHWAANQRRDELPQFLAGGAPQHPTEPIYELDSGPSVGT